MENRDGTRVELKWRVGGFGTVFGNNLRHSWVTAGYLKARFRRQRPGKLNEINSISLGTVSAKGVPQL